jgi:secreted Zn-dependent insulinase-like peptidase
MMNKKLLRKAELNNIILGIEMNLSLLEQDLDVVESNLSYLSKIQKDLIYNINLHKTGKVISVMSEYKKSIYELKMVRDEMIKYNNFKKNIVIKMNDYIKSYDRYLDELENIHQSLNNESVILLFKGKNE